MADRRLQNILSHLSPPVTTLELPKPSRCLGSGLGHFGEFSGNLGAGEDDRPCQETVSQPGKLFEFECRGPNSGREAKLMENLMLSRLHRFYSKEKCNALGSHSELRLLPCRGELKSLDKPEELVEANLVTRELENLETSRESEQGTGNCEGEGELTVSAETVRSGITSASTVSSSGAAGFNEGQSRTNLEGKTRGHLSASRVAACEFCDIIQGTTPCFKLYEDELCLCILDINPLSFGHSLILPKTHFPCLEATPPRVAAAMCAAVPLISSALLAATQCDSFNMLVNSGVAAGQVIMHTHFHIIPRCKGDGLWKSESATRKPMRKVQEAKSLCDVIRSKLSSTVGSVTQQEPTPLGFNREGLN
ncbi:hypothetical protein KC19_2G026900 [Ceratodon purpureus]|uniref:HIT domain-containing protein n=1 Tax=Ceratodon purpureus TaxID=3225 RepID=A0A8T0IRF4_CERPU|nr:hypothetical protein KC19_2G026900 [Ceratodon purpureus]